jgi:tetratricopeptide (TPR) repeat protein
MKKRCEVIYRQLAQQDPDKYLPLLARTLYNWGESGRLQNRMDEARQHYEEALKIYLNWRNKIRPCICPIWPNSERPGESGSIPEPNGRSAPAL